MKKIPDEQIIGSVSGRLTIQAITGVSARKKRLVLCSCECGGSTVINISQFRAGATRSCGCLHKERAKEHMKSIRHLGQGNRLRHGKTDSPEYYVWRTMKQRCTNPKSQSFHRYGGRGIGICKRWELFDNFIADMGPRPTARHTIERNNNDGSYEPSNCRWATSLEQGRNRSTNVRITYNGVTLTMVDWARKLGISKHALWNRLKKGWPLEVCLVGPIRHRKSLISKK